MTIEKRIAALQTAKWPIHSDYSSRLLRRMFPGGGNERDQAVAEARVHLLQEQLDVALELLKALAEIPVEAFEKEHDPDQALMGWNKHVLYVRDCLNTRNLLDACGYGYKLPQKDQS